MSLVLIDYGAGNLRSAAKAFERMIAETGRDEAVTVQSQVARLERGEPSPNRRRQLWIVDEAIAILPRQPTVYGVGPLLKALITEAMELSGSIKRDEYTDRVTQLILDQLSRATPIAAALPWPRSKTLTRICEALYANPADSSSSDEWARELAISPRTLTRRFEDELGMSLRSWRRHMRIFKAIELLGGGMDVTRVAMDLGYGSSSAFIYAFRTAMGVTPQVYMRGRH